VVTRADVANLAGVSPAVVSYVINGGPRPVSKAARAQVIAAIEALGYRPNAVASALRGGSTKSIGLLMPSPINPYFAELAEAVESELLSAGYQLSVGITHEDAIRELVHVRSLIDRRVDGLLLASSRALTSMRSSRDTVPPVVVVDRVDGDDHVSSVHVDNVRDAAYAVEHLQSWGHRLIGCVSGPWPISISRERVQGWREQQNSIGAPSGSNMVSHAEFSAQGGAEAARALLDGESRRLASVSGGRPTALFVTSDAQAHGVLHVCHQLHLRVPEDISIVSFDGTESARFTLPVLSTMRQPIQQIGSTAVRMLLKSITDRDSAPRTVILRSNLVVGESCAAPSRPVEGVL
jgi:LacI family transcriptional regulator